MLFSEKEKEEKLEKRRKRKTDDKPRGIRACLHSRGAKEESEANDCGHCLAEAVSQGFAGENYARRASFSMCKRRSRLTLTGRRRQATFAVFLFLDGHHKCRSIKTNYYAICETHNHTY